jgi:hypothetical protein
MSGLFKHVGADGSVSYSDRPPADAGSTQTLRSDGRAQSREGNQAYEDAKAYIKEAQKRGPKLVDYLQYIEYLRNHNPWKLDRVLRELQHNDPETWLKLQKYPQFKPIANAALGLKAGEKHLLSLPSVAGKFTGGAERWFETTVKDLMKRDRWGPYADVLGAKATTLPAPPTPQYSRSRLGQYLKGEDARAAQAAKAAANNLEASRAAVRASRATAVSRVGNPLIEVGIGALNPEVFNGISYIQGVRLAKELEAKGILDQDEAYMLPRMLAAQQFDKAMEMIRAGKARAEGR